MKALALRILAIRGFGPLRRFAYRIALDYRGVLSVGFTELIIRRSLRVRRNRDFPVSAWDRDVLMAAVSNVRSRRALTYLFRLLIRRQNFAAAIHVAESRPFDSYPIDIQVSIIKFGYYAMNGVVSDQRLSRLLAEKSRAIARWPTQRFMQIVDAILFSGFNINEKLEMLAGVRGDSPLTGMKRVRWESALVEAKRLTGIEEPTPPQFAEIIARTNPTDSDLDLVRAYWSVARESLDRSTTAAFMKRALASSAVTVKHLPFICRELSDDDILDVTTVDDIFKRLADFPQVLNFRSYTPNGSLAAEIVQRGVTYWFEDKDRKKRSRFDNATGDIQNQIVGILNRADRWSVLEGRLEHSIFSDTHLDISFARALTEIAADDYSSALVRCEQILRQHPGHRLSWMGLQWASVRATGELDRIESLRREIGQGVAHAGRPTMLETAAEESVMTSRMWRGDFRRNALSSIRPAWRAVQLQFGERFVDYSKFLDPDTTRDLLIVPINGVSDEVRDAYEYTDLVGKFRSITALCDPRLQQILSTSFPSIRFVPFARRDKALQIEDRRESPVQGVPTVLANFVPDSLREFVMAE